MFLLNYFYRLRGQGYNNGSYGGGYGGAGQTQGYGSQSYGYGQAQSYDGGVGADYVSGGYATTQDSRYSVQTTDPYGEYAKPTRHYEAGDSRFFSK